MRVGIFNHFCKSATMHLKTFSEEQLLGDIGKKVQSMNINSQVEMIDMASSIAKDERSITKSPIPSVQRTIVPSSHHVAEIDYNNPIDSVSISSLGLSCAASAIYASVGMQDDQISLYSSAPSDFSCPTSVL